MAMKPILFNTDMVQAILDGRKTVTRRVVKFQHGQNPQWTGYIPDGHVLYGSNNIPAAKAPYRLGDILYVRETWRIQAAHRFEADARIEFKAGGPLQTIQFPGSRSQGASRIEYDEFLDKWLRSGWCPSIHMPKEAARMFLRVTDVRVERLQHITPEQIDAEGCKEWGYSAKTRELLPSGPSYFQIVWNSTVKNKDLPFYGWNANPWVWVISFERISRDEAQKGGAK